MPSPFDFLDSQFDFLGPARRRRPSARFTSLPPEQEAALLSKILDKSMGGLQYAGETIDKFGRATRGLLAGDPAELANIIPFSDALGITDNDGPLADTMFHVTDRKDFNSGRDLLEQAGILASNRPGLDWGDVAGFGVEVMTDPLTYLTMGASAVTKAGSAARAAGLLDDAGRALGTGKRVGRLRGTVDDLIRNAGPDAPDATQRLTEAAQAAGTTLDDIRHQPLGGVAGVGLPFQDPAFVLGKAGGMGESIAAGMDRLGGMAAASPLGRAGKMMFDPASGGRYGLHDQEVAQAAYRGKKPAQAAARREFLKAMESMDETFREFDATFGDQARAMGQANPNAPFGPGQVVRATDRGNYGYVRATGDDTADVWFRNPQTGATSTVSMAFDQLEEAFPAGSAQAEDFAQQMTRTIFEDIVRMTAERQGNAEEAMDWIMPGSRPTPEMADAIASRAAEMQQANDFIYRNIERKGGNVRWLEDTEELFKHFPRYVDPSRAAEKGFKEPRVLSPAFGSMKRRTEEIQKVPSRIINDMLTDAGTRGDDATTHILGQYRQFLDPKYKVAEDQFVKDMTATINNPDTLIQIGDDGVADLQQRLDDYIADYDGTALHAEDLTRWLEDKPKSELFTRQTLDDFLKYQESAHQTSMGIEGIHEVFANHIGTDGLPVKEAFEAAGLRPEAVTYLARKMGKSVDELADARIPEEVVNAAAGVMKAHQDPEWGSVLGKAIDKYTNIFKAGVTLPFPAFYTRNFISGQHINMTSGLVNTPADVAAYGKAMAAAKKAMPDQSSELAKEAYIYGVIHPKYVAEGVESGRRADPMLGVSPFAGTRMRAADHVANNPSALDAIPGVKAARRGANVAKQTGSKAAERVEWLNRVPMYQYLREKGWSPVAAARKVDELQFDYGASTPFEKQFMKRLVPFWSFQKKIIPLTMRTILERPGGPLAQSVRAANQGRKEAGFVPEYIGEGASVQVGDGRFISGFGLGFEDPLSRFAIAPTTLKTVGRTMEKAVSSTNPLVSGAYTFASGRDPFFGRELTELYPYPTDDIMTNAVLSKTPISRGISSARKVGDTRKELGIKAADLLTGVKITDVSGGLERQRDFEVMRALGELFQESPNVSEYTRFYVRPEDMATLKPEEAMYMRLLNTQEKRKREAADKRRRSPLQSL